MDDSVIVTHERGDLNHKLQGATMLFPSNFEENGELDHQKQGATIVFPEKFEEDDDFDDERTDDGQFPCRLCNKFFSNRALLNVHYTHTHRDKPQYDCEDCGLIFTVKRELATHRRIHTGSPLHTCNQCGKVFGTKQLLKKHHLWHTGQRSHICPQCGKAFYQKGHLTQHLMIHTGGRPHVCHLCRKTFVFKFDLNRHLKIHAERGHLLDSFAEDGSEIKPFDAVLSRSTASPFSMGSPSHSVSPPDNQPDDQPSPDCAAAADVCAAQQLAAANLFFAGGGAGAAQPMSLGDWFAFQAAYQATLSQHLLQQQMGNGVGNGSGAGNGVGNGNGELEHDTVDSSDASASPQEKVGGEEDGEEQRQGSPGKFVFMEGSADTNRAACSPATDHHSQHHALDHTCPQCVSSALELKSAHRRIAELEQILDSKNSELERLKQRTNRVGTLAGSLLETCSDFDKLWMLHSKKVYNSVQTILNTLH